MPYGATMMAGSWWRSLTECGPLDKGMANHFSILASRTPWTVWKGKMTLIRSDEEEDIDNLRIFLSQTTNKLQKAKRWLWWTGQPGDQGLHHKWVDIMCGTSPCETLEEQCVLLVISCPKSIDQEGISDRSRFLISLQNESLVLLKNCWVPER